MKLECRIKRKGGTIVDLPNPDGTQTRIHFKPLDPTREDSPHVAEVSAAQAQRFFMADAQVYVVFEAPTAPKLDRPPPPAPPASDPPPPPAPPAGSDTDQTGGDDDHDEDTNGDGLISLKELRAAIAAGMAPERIRELLEAEQQAPKPRKAAVTALTQALKA